MQPKFQFYQQAWQAKLGKISTQPRKVSKCESLDELEMQSPFNNVIFPEVLRRSCFPLVIVGATLNDALVRAKLLVK